MTEIKKSKRYDLEDRSKNFAKRCRDYVNKLPKTIANIEYGKQLIKSSGSQAANYIEANEAFSKKDFIMRAKISRKETKESRLWLDLTEPFEENQKEKEALIQEATELMNIYGAIVRKSE